MVFFFIINSLVGDIGAIGIALVSFFFSRYMQSRLERGEFQAVVNRSKDSRKSCSF